jgi:pimeloyl-ACP methyl ester carboxylesterase
MKKLAAAVICLLLAALVLPPLWFTFYPQPSPTLPPPGRYVEVSPGTRVNVIEEGDGPPVVLVHGHPGTAYDWRDLMSELARRGFRALAYDRVGYGRSDARRNGDYTIDANAEELLALLDVEHLEKAIVVGWSYGGGTGIVAARKDGSRISRLVLVGSVGPGIQNREAPPQILVELMVHGGFRWLSYVPPLNRRLRATLTAEAFSPAPIAPGYLQQLGANFAAPHTLTSFTSEGRDLDGAADLDPSSVDVPILIVQGEGDQLVPLSVAEELHRRAGGSQLQVIAKSGHMLPITHAAELAEMIAVFAR